MKPGILPRTQTETSPLTETAAESAATAPAAAATPVEGTAGSTECSICLEEMDQATLDHSIMFPTPSNNLKAVEGALDVDYGHCCMQLDCGHTFGSDCINEWLLKNNHCPLCRKPIATERAKNVSSQCVLVDHNLVSIGHLGVSFMMPK